MISAVGVGVAGLGGYAAHVVLVPGDPDVSLLAPGGAPAVPHDPEVHPVLGAVADQLHAVVQLHVALVVTACTALITPDPVYYI